MANGKLLRQLVTSGTPSEAERTNVRPRRPSRKNQRRTVTQPAPMDDIKDEIRLP